MKIRIGIIDSGVHASHPHVGGVAGGIHIQPEGLDNDHTDRIGHGTAVAGAIREKVPDAQLYAVKVFDRQLTTSSEILLRALDWCLEARLDFINLSLGTRTLSHAAAFEERIRRASAGDVQIVAPYESNGEKVLPGSLAGVVAVVLDNSLPRDRFEKRELDGRLVFAAAGYPREIPGVPRERNLQGISFAVANVTGLLAAERMRCLCR